MDCLCICLIIIIVILIIAFSICLYNNNNNNKNNFHNNNNNKNNFHTYYPDCGSCVTLDNPKRCSSYNGDCCNIGTKWWGGVGIIGCQ